jgi:type III pantothenate kinase
MKLLADIGNSQIKVAETQNQNLLKIKSFPLEDIDKFHKYITKTYINKDCTLFYSSVLGVKFNKEFKKKLKGIFVKETEFKSTKSLMSVKNCYPQASKLGPDRWAQIVAAYRIFKKNIMIVSCGSAISIDYVTESGIHKGGLILSGAERYINCFSDIHNLKNIKLNINQNKNSNILQSNTLKQITTGYRVMISSSINEIYSNLCQSSKPKPKLLITGSYSKNISRDLKIKCLVEPYFVLKSLALIQDQD